MLTLSVFETPEASNTVTDACAESDTRLPPPKLELILELAFLFRRYQDDNVFSAPGDTIVERVEGRRGHPGATIDEGKEGWV